MAADKYPPKVVKQIARIRKNLRVLSDRKQGEIAQKAGLSRVFLSYVINGRSECGLGTFLALASATGQTLDDLANKDISADRK